MSLPSNEIALPATIAVIGLGLIGGSLARDLAARGARVLGYDRDPQTLREAAAVGVEPLDRLTRESLSEAEVVVLGLPVTAALDLLPDLAPILPGRAVVTDVGSTKRSIAAAARAAGLGGRFVGAHPLAGDHRSGWGAAREGLFAGAPVFLCATPETDPGVAARVEALWRALGARVERIDPDAHDVRLAWTSHLPQVGASALAAVLQAEGWRPEQMGPGGRDSTRLAGSSPEIWTAIARDNAAVLGPAVDALSARLAEFAVALRADDAAAIHAFFAEGRAWTRSAPSPE